MKRIDQVFNVTDYRGAMLAPRGSDDPAFDSAMIGRIISHYSIERPLGAGGMGQVYLARDLALGRAAAIKLVADPIDPSLRVRLVREAEACARLQHPAIATFYEAGEADGVAFIAMEFVDGETLRTRLRRGPLTVPDTVALASALLEALNHAHAAGLLHRDIKPENIMISADGHPKLLDFGLAKAAAGLVGDQGTMTSLSGMAIVGTIGYMSPEQIEGRALDARSDVFSLGAVLYEALAGRPAFPGATVGERMAAILSRDPPGLGDVLPRALTEMVSRALSRDVDLRYRSAAEFLSAVRRFAAGGPATVIAQTLAIVDFENLSGEASDNWIASGLAESLQADLTRVSGLRVIAREKVLKTCRALVSAGSEAGADSLEVGNVLGCRWVLSGGFQKSGRAIRITTRLAEVATGAVVSAEKLDGTIDGIFEIQDRVSAAVVESLNLRVPASGPQAATPGAFELYARARRLQLRQEKGTLEQARELYEEAVGLDPNYGQALNGLATVHALRFTFTTDPRELELAAGYARRAIQVDPRAGEPHIWLAYTLMRQNRLREAYAETQLGESLDPTGHFAPYFGGGVSYADGRRAEAIASMQRSIAVDQQRGFAWLGLGWCHLEQGHGREARWCLERALELERSGAEHATAGIGGYLGECLRQLGDPVAARAACLAGLEAAEASDNMYRDTFRGVALCSLGRSALDMDDPEAARAAFQQTVAHLRGRTRTLGGGLLMVQALAGLARATRDASRLQEARVLLETRDGFDFSWFWNCTDHVALLELAHAAQALGEDDAPSLFLRARVAGQMDPAEGHGENGETGDKGEPRSP